MKFISKLVTFIPAAILLAADLIACQAVAIDPVVKLCQSPGQFAMTFDQGPSIYTGAILDAFDSRNVKATFHPIVTYLSEASVVANLQRAAASGHTIGLSMEANIDLSQQSDSEIMETIESRAETIQSIVGIKPVFLRIPNYKSLSKDQLKLIMSKGYIVTTYNLDSYDYSTPNVMQSYKNILDLLSPNTKGAFISVQRDYVQDSANATPDIIDYVLEKGYTLVTLEKCVRNAPVAKSPNNNGSSGNVPAGGNRVPNINGKTTPSDSLSAFSLLALAAPVIALIAA